MKMILVGLGLALMARLVSAQTNVFPLVCSVSGVPLMTNAEFRCFSGNRIIFKDAEGYRVLPAAVVEMNVLTKLGTTLDALNAKQEHMDAQLEQQRLATAERLAKAQTIEARRQYEMAHPQSRIVRTGKYDELRSNGNFIGQ